MKDTSPEINAMMFQRVMALTEGERLLMGLSMLETSRAIVWGSLPEDLDLPARRKAFYRRFYGQELPEAVAHWQGRIAVLLPLDPDGFDLDDFSV